MKPLQSSFAASLIVFACNGAVQAQQQWNPQPDWKDSYAVGGRCYCSSNFDHGLGNKSADTPLGRRPVRQICADIERELGSGSPQGRVHYNDIQCGNGPANDAADERGCPGRVDMGSAGCDVIGPRWDLEAVYGRPDGDVEAPPADVSAPATSAQREVAENCDALGDSLGGAQDAFAASCPGITRRDCDPLADGGWRCSSEEIASGAPAMPASPAPEAASEPGTETASEVASESASEPGAGAASEPETESAARDEPVAAVGSCDALGDSLGGAKAAFAASCPGIARRDCDPVAGGGWRCSSEEIASGAPAAPARPASGSVSEPEAAPAVQEPVAASGGCDALGSSLGGAKAAFAASCPGIARRDCDPVAGGGWRCSSEEIASGAPAAPTRPSPVESAPQAGPSVSNPDGASGVGRIDGGDLIALHYDNCPDRDDGQAAAAGKTVLATTGLTNFIVTNGTCGDGARARGAYQPESVAVVRAAFGDDFIDAFGGGSAAVDATADRWAATLANGDDVWVAEGGPSDHTARVLRRIGSIYPSVNRKRVHVVQHSSGGSFNEAQTSRANIALVKEVADYITIPNGNVGGNGSADLNAQSAFFVRTALDSRFSGEWRAAFAYLDPTTGKLDFSDTVELLYIIGDDATKTVDDFARRYLQ